MVPMMSSPPDRIDSLRAPAIAVLGMVALASAMGVGRFAFTPLMPLMQAHGALTFGQGAWLAGANYGGYLVGALACIVKPPQPHRAGRAAMVAVAVFTLAMGLTADLHAWLALRFAAGVASAYVLVSVSAWALPELARLDRAGWTGGVYAGVGLGIAAVGVVSLAAGWARIEPAALWLILGAGSAAAAALSWSPMGRPATRGRTALPATAPWRNSEWCLIGCYGLFGFGYIVPASFLPAMAREWVDDPAVFGWVWPVFGAVAAVSTVCAAWALRRWSPRRIWVWSLWIMAVGVLAPALVRTGASVLWAAVCVGATFMVVTMVGMLEARRHAEHAATLMAAITAAFATGQSLGPWAVGLMASQGPAATRVASVLAAIGLLLSAGVLLACGDRSRGPASTRP